MKSYNVKSNAKRFARGIAAKYPELYEASEPHHAPDGEWFPAVNVLADKFAFVADDVRAVCIINNEDPGEVVVSLAGLEGEAEPEAPATIPAANIEAVVTAVVGPEAMAAMAASLPPRQTSSAEEIQRRRAERRAAIEADKASGVRDRLGRKVEPEKINKKKTILDLVGREGGATQEELEDATGWQRHTLRGYIAGTLRKLVRKVGRDIECQRGKDKPTRYVMVTVKEGGA